MRQALAWELAKRALRHELEARAKAALLALPDVKAVRDLDVAFHLRSLSARVLFAPGYLITYTYGEHQHGSLTIIKQRHQALVPAASGGTVATERHISPRKAQAAAAAGCFAAAGLPVALWGDPGAGIVSVDNAFAAFMAASAAGVVARGFTGYLRDRHARVIEGKAETFSDEYMRSGMSASDAESAKDQWLRNDLEWTRWEESEKWDWDAQSRQRWAERLFEEHKTRKLVNEAFVRKQEEDEHKQQEQAARDARKAAKFGRSFRRQQFSARKQGGRRFDFKGYYKALGIAEDELPMLSDKSIKHAYRKRAKKLHPDLNAHLDKSAREHNLQSFQKLQVAYEVLKDPEKRKQYDAGGHVEV